MPSEMTAFCVIMHVISQGEKKLSEEKTTAEFSTISDAAEKAMEPPKKPAPKDTKVYDPAKCFEIEGPAGTIGVVRGHLNLQRLAGKSVAVAVQGVTVDQRTYEMTWMSVMLQFVTQSPGYLPAYCNGNIDKFLENIYEFDDLTHYYSAWESWRNSFRVSGPLA